ncbi:MAG: glyoxylate/hydroxypyruvate reductase A [Sneathiellales bacterium]|nr:glyoxylate/hydroxypyruvate reductase A [Sneathiellales bacterium]
MVSSRPEIQKTIPFVGQVPKSELESWVSLLSEKMPNESIRPFTDLSAEERKIAEIAIVANPDPDEVAELTSLKWVHSVWAGVEKLVSELGDRPFEIIRLVDPELARTMSDAVLSWTLYLHRDMPAYAALQKKRQWEELPFTRASDKTVGILGLGNLGIEAASCLGSFGFNVIGWSRSLKDIKDVRCLAGEEGLKEIFKKSDILVSLLPLTPQTRGLLSSSLFSLCKDGAGFINFGRGAVVNSRDLLKALDSGSLNHAVLDVFETEPLPQDDPFWGHEKVTVLPHISAPSDIGTASSIVAANLRTYRETGTLPKSVDKKRGY